MILNGSQIFVEVLAEQGVDTIFGYPGGAVLNLYDELYKNSDRIRHILTAHEQGASHAADGYARATGRTGVVLATSGPGATNLVTGVADAYLDGAPLVAITGQVGTDRLHIPVVNTMMAKGIIPMDDKYSLWTIGIPQKDYVNQLFDRADPYSVLFYLLFVIFIFE